MGEFLNSEEYARRKDGRGGADKLLTSQQSTGPISTASAWGSICRDQSQMPSSKPPFFLKVSKIRELISCVEGVF